MIRIIANLTKKQPTQQSLTGNPLDYYAIDVISIVVRRISARAEVA
jgi:hypothetical protein